MVDLKKPNFLLNNKTFSTIYGRNLLLKFIEFLLKNKYYFFDLKDIIAA